MRALRRRSAGFDPRIGDTIFAAAVILELELQCWLGGGVPDAHRPVTAVASAFFAAPIAIRRDWPGFALPFCAAIAVVSTLLGGELLTNLNGDVAPVLVLAYSAGTRLDAPQSVRTMVLGLALLVTWAFVPGAGGPPTGLGAIAQALFYVAMLVVPAWFVGRLVRGHAQRTTAFREPAAIVEERTRIGSELQDIIAHSVSAMVIQAGGARRALRSDPDRARDAILNVEQTGREALADLRRLLGMLRKDDDPGALAPQPGLKQLGTLIESMRAAGRECELQAEGEPIDLTPGVDLVGYRVIEAVLYSAARHRSLRTVVTIRYRPHELQLDVLGDAPLLDLDHDLHGIVERVALYDGSVRAVPADGGFAVEARLPVAEAIPA
jgi:signal transduction histidine kinase